MKHREKGFIVNDCGELSGNTKGEIQRNAAPSFALALQKSENIVFLHRSLDVPDKLPLRIVQELDSDLSNTSTRSSPTEDLFRPQH